MKLYDSNILIYAAEPAGDWLAALWQAGGFVSAITQVETLGYRLLTAQDALFFRTAFGQLTVLPVARLVIEEAIRLRQAKNLKLGDALIAATALKYRLPLVTRNVKDFAGIAGLRVENPFPLVS